MKKDLHPEYAEATITCACGAVVRIGSTGKNMHVNTCSACHPFFTGKSALVDADGRVEKFKKRYARK